MKNEPEKYQVYRKMIEKELNQRFRLIIKTSDDAKAAKAYSENTSTGFVNHNRTEHEVDAIVCATGFDTSWIPRFPLTVNGVDLSDTRTNEGVLSYFGVAVPEIPNYFSFCGPYGPLAPNH